MQRFFKYRFATAAALILAALSCTREAGVQEAFGALEVDLWCNAPEIIVKSATPTADDIPFTLTIAGEDGRHNYSIADHRTLAAEPLLIPAGKYTISAKGGDADGSGWGVRSWKGSTSLTVKPEQQNRATISCSLDGDLVSIELEDAILDAAKELELSIGNGSDAPLSFSLEDGNLADTAYLAFTGTLSYELRMLNNDGISYTSGVKTIDSPANGKHYHIKVSVKENEPDYILSVSVDGNSVAAPDLSVRSGKATTIPVVFKASRGAASVFIRHNEPGLKSIGLPEWSDLVSSGDLGALSSAGVVCSRVNGGYTNDISIEISSLVNRMPVGVFKIIFGITDIYGSTYTSTCNITIIPLVESRVIKASPWARFATVQAEWYTLETPAGLKFQFRGENDSAWTDVSNALRFDNAAKKVSVDIYGLAPGAKYYVRSISDSDIAAGNEMPEISFTTDANVPTVPYMDFDNWCKSGDAWMPNPSGAATVWDTANPGTASLGTVPTTPETSDVVSGSAVRMESTTAGMLGINKFAAGNIYLGQFNKVEGTTGASLKWGYRFNGRPIALRGYYKYKPVNIDYAESPMTGLKGTPDWGSIRIFLCNWSQQFLLNTATGNFLQEDDPSVIASAGLYFNTTNSSYVHFTLPVHYNDNRTPTFIEIACAASRYGDYFTGGKGSVLLIDEFELVYDPADLTEAEREAIGYR